MRRSLRARAACVAVLAAAVGCSAGGGAGAGPQQDSAAEVARRLQGEWEGPCFITEAGLARTHEYTFSGSDVRFSVWTGCGAGQILLDRAFGTFAIGPRLAATVSGAGFEAFEVVAWQLDVTWATSAVSRTAVALTDPRDPEPYVLFAAWDAEAVSSALVPTRYASPGAPALVFAEAIVGTWARCVSATRADLRSFEVGLLKNPYAEGFFTFEDVCLGRRTGTSPIWGEWVLGAPIIAALDGALVTGHDLWVNTDESWRMQIGFISRSADGDTLYLSELSPTVPPPVRTLSSAGGAWVRVNYALPPRPPGPIEEGGPPPPSSGEALSGPR